MTVGLVLKGYPRLSETFIAQEIRALEEQGITLRLISLRHPTDKAVHPVHREIVAPVLYLPEYLHDEAGRVWRAWRIARRLPGYAAAVSAFRRDLARDRSRNRVRRFGQALVLAAEEGGRLGLLYAHFIHTPCSVTRYAALMLGRPFAISAHAKDIWTTPDWELTEKLGEAEWTVTCTKAGRDALAALAPEPARVHLVYHGLDLARFPSPPHRPVDTGRGADLHLFSVGRAVAKKGFDTLLDALARLPADLDWRWTHVGGGPLRDALKEQASRLGIAARCTFRGALPQEAVLALYREADLFVLPCRIDDDGDRDGLPNVIVEAASQRLPVISTPISGVPELIGPEEGVLVPPDDPAALAEAIAALARDPARRLALGEAAERKVRAGFDHRAGAIRIAGLIRDSLARHGESGR